MSSKPENTFIASVHRHLPPLVAGEAGRPYREKMYNPLRGGTWDVFYSGNLADLWVEYKFIVIPVRDTTLILPDLSPLQIAWGKERWLEGRNLRVIVGCKEGGVIFADRTWEHPITAEAFRAALLDRKTLSERIVDLTQRSA